MIRAWIALTVAGVAVALAQESPSHSLEEQTLNAGGHPAAGINPGSASHRITLGSLGEPVALRALGGPSLRLDGGFVAPYPPPGEVSNLALSLAATLTWDPEPSAGRYNVYRGDIVSLSGLGYGACFEANLTSVTTSDAAVPSVGGGFFYLVTAENRLGEQGTKGFRSDGVERAGLVCP